MDRKNKKEKIEHKEKINRPSVLMANYNKGEYIGEAIQSVINQTFPDWELIIFDDKSTDNSVEIIKTYLYNKRIKFFQNESNEGKISVLRKMIKLAENDILVIFDSDDYLEPFALEEVIGAYNEHPDCGFIYSRCFDCDENLKPLSLGASCKIPKGKSNIFDMYITHLRTFRRSSFLLTSGYDDETVFAEDRDKIIKMEEVTSFYFIDKVLHKYRFLQDSQSNSKRNVARVITSIGIAKFKAFRRRQGTNLPNLNKREMSSDLFWYLPFAIKARDWKWAVIFFKEGIRLHPLNIKSYFYLCFRLIKFPFYRLLRMLYPKIEKIYE